MKNLGTAAHFFDHWPQIKQSLGQNRTKLHLFFNCVEMLMSNIVFLL